MKLTVARFGMANPFYDGPSLLETVGALDLECSRHNEKDHEALAVAGCDL